MTSSDNALIEEVIKRRLQVDGDGMGDDRKINSLAKSFISLVDSEDTEENDCGSLKRFIGQVRHMEYVARRTIEAIRVNKEAAELYFHLKEEVQNEIRMAKDNIESSKTLLEEATKHRKYSMEYDALAKLIESKPDRKMTEVKRMGLALELDILKKKQATLDKELDFRKRTVSMLSGSIEMVKDLVSSSEEKITRHRKSPKKSKKRKHQDASSTPTLTPQMEMDSQTSQSEPPSPPSEQLTPQEAMNGTPDTIIVSNSDSMTIIQGDTEKSKSEKYEDLSESEGVDFAGSITVLSHS